jgi:Na+/H+ antiporter NhaD/arsenite permease-like protein
LPLLYLTAAISAVILVLANRKYTKKPMGKILKDVEWEIIFFFISMYVVINCMLQAGFRDIIGMIPFESFGPILTVFIILILVSLLSGFVANTPIALIFLPTVPQQI